MDLIFVAARRSDGGTSIVQLVAKAPIGAFSPDVAAREGYSVAGIELGDDGKLVIVGEPCWQHTWSDDEISAHLDRMGYGITEWLRCGEDPRPEHVPYHRALSLAGGVLSLDMDRARNMRRDELRTLRGPLLAALDVEYWRADEAGDAKRKGRIAERKQALRDVTKDPAIDAAGTPAELAAVLPSALKDQ